MNNTHDWLLPPPGRLEVRHLRLVRAIAAEASVTRAANRLHLSQSAVSHQLVDLERDLGARLFDRVGKRMVPTAAGARLIGAAGPLLQELAALEQELSAQTESRTALRVTTSCYVSYNWLPAALTHFQASHPRLDLNIVIEATRRALPALLADEVDLAIMTDPPRDRTWECVEIAASDAVAIHGSAHPIAARARTGGLRWGDLADCEILVQDIPDHYVARLTQAIAGPPRPDGQHPSARAPIRKIPTSEALLELVRAGRGVAVVDHWTVPTRLHRDLRVSALLPRSSRVFHGVWRRSNPRALPLLELARVIRQVTATLPGTSRARRQSARSAS